jgi:hypothetical protein
MGKVAAIDSTGGTNWAAKGHDYDPFLTSFISGSGGYASDWDKEQDTDTTLIIRGLGGGSQKAIKHCLETGREFYAIDTGYMGNNKHKRWHRITRNALQNLGPIKSRPHDRLDRLEYKFKTFTPGSKILLCPPSDKVMSMFDQGTAEEWVERTVKEIEKHTDRLIEIRMKPTRSERVTNKTIQAALADDVHCLITFNSIAATEALLEGKPAITLGPNSAQLICNTSLDKIENIKIPSEDETVAYFAHLSYAQFTQEEMSNGYAWKILQEDTQ